MRPQVPADFGASLPSGTMEAGKARLPTSGENSGGIPCGPADISLFNGLMRETIATQREVAYAATQAGAVAADAGSATQLWEAIQAAVASGGTVDTSTFRTVTSGPSTSPPSSPASGDEALVADNPTGAFAGHARKLARYNGAAWSFTTVRAGRIFRVNNTATYWTLDATTGWQAHAFPPAAHTHPISDITGLQAALTSTQTGLDGKVAKAGDTMTGALLMPAGTLAAPALARSGNTNTGIMFPAADTLALVTGGVEGLRLGPAGQLGLGGANYGDAARVLTGNASGPPVWASPSALMPSFIWSDMRYASGSPYGSGAVNFTWNTVPLNTIIKNDIGVSFNSVSKEFTLVPGIYEISFFNYQQYANDTKSQLRLFSQGNNTTWLVSTVGFGAGYYPMITIIGNSIVNLSAQTTFLLQIYMGGNANSALVAGGEPSPVSQISVKKVG